MTWHVCEALFAVTASRSAALPWKLALSSKEASGVRRRVSVKAGVRRGHAGPGLVLQNSNDKQCPLWRGPLKLNLAVVIY
jgi:hypothetical protein